MTSKTSPLITLIVIAIVLFISALIWKNFRVDNSETITIQKPINNKLKNETPPVLPISNNVTGKKDLNDITKTHNGMIQDENITDDDQIMKFAIQKKQSNPNYVLTDAENKANFNNLQLMKKMQTNLKTPEQVLAKVKHYQDIGDEQLADKYIDFLIRAFPDYQQ